MRFAVGLLLAPGLLAQVRPAGAPPDPSVEDLRAFQAWLADYEQGAYRLVKGGREDPAALAEVDRLVSALARWATLDAAKALFAAAKTNPSPPGSTSATDRVAFHHELQAWKVRQLASERIAAMQAPGLDAWLESCLASAFAAADGGDVHASAAAVRILGLRGSVASTVALLRATHTLPKEQRARAIHALSQLAGRATVPHFLGLLPNAEPNVRIAALNALGKAMAPLTDETQVRTPDAEADGLRDQVIKAMQALLQRDPVWQVRAAAAENLARLKTKHAIPALIAGLEAELRRTQDPWAMDLRIHRLLEGLTGQDVVTGSAEPWQRFWQKEGPGFAFARTEEEAKATSKGKTKYQRFFSIDLETDRVLFVLDFSGSMQEPVTLETKVTAAPGGQSTTKARIVVEELKKIVAALPDGTLLNVIVFSDDVRVWRSEQDGKPSLVRLDDASRDDLLGSWLDILQPQGATNLWGALDRALGFAGRGLWDKYYGAGFDTLYVLSDGQPSWGEVVDVEEILRRVREANALRRLTIHTVTFGDKNETRFLKRLAEENGGRHVHVE